MEKELLFTSKEKDKIMVTPFPNMFSEDFFPWLVKSL